MRRLGVAGNQRRLERTGHPDIEPLRQFGRQVGAFDQRFLKPGKLAGPFAQTIEGFPSDSGCLVAQKSDDCGFAGASGERGAHGVADGGAFGNCRLMRS